MEASFLPPIVVLCEKCRNIIRLRKAAHLSQQQVADEASMSLRNYQRLENGGMKTMDAVMLHRIATAIGVQVSMFFEENNIGAAPFQKDADAGAVHDSASNSAGAFLQCIHAFTQQQKDFYERLIMLISGGRPTD